jgi:predicted Rossmann fold flavoprotein
MQEAEKHLRYDAVIIGGGAAGLMCALTAGQRGRRVALIEHNESVGKKIAISGGGRCNFTNIHASAANYLSASPDFCKSALARYTPWNFIALVEKHSIAYHEKKLGQQFCDGSSREIIDMLLAECATAEVEILCNCRVREVRKPERFSLETNRGLIECDSLVIATGGLSFAKLGATDFGHRIARDFGMRITEMRPGLVPLTFDLADIALHELSGVSLPVIARHRGVAFHEAMLFTHRGVSGPAILQISSYWRENETLCIDLLPALYGAEWLLAQRQSQNTLNDLLEHHLPRRLAGAWCARHAPAKALSHFKTRELESIVQLLHEWPLNFSGTEGYPKAEVTLGGVDTREISSKTMESAKVPGLYFIGEVVDVTGWLGGYNFQWAWASGHSAGQFV